MGCGGWLGKQRCGHARVGSSPAHVGTRFELHAVFVVSAGEGGARGWMLAHGRVAMDTCASAHVHWYRGLVAW
eukprot:107176-Chlamydomonas_euryale.AAC.1